MKPIKLTFTTTGLALALGVMTLAAAPVSMAGEGADLFDDCKICHIVKLNELKRKKGPTLIEKEDATRAPTGEQNEASTPAMCLSCHDGFVADSRAMWKQGHLGHRVGMAPSEKIQPAMYDDEPVFPMNDDGLVYCGSCHSGHAGEGEAENAPIFLRANPADGNICQGCHADKASIVGSPHVRRAGKSPDYQKGGTCSAPSATCPTWPPRRRCSPALPARATFPSTPPAEAATRTSPTRPITRPRWWPGPRRCARGSGPTPAPRCRCSIARTSMGAPAISAAPPATTRT